MILLYNTKKCINTINIDICMYIFIKNIININDRLIKNNKAYYKIDNLNKYYTWVPNSLTANS